MHPKYGEILLNGGAFVAIKIAPEMKEVLRPWSWIEFSVVLSLPISCCRVAVTAKKLWKLILAASK